LLIKKLWTGVEEMKNSLKGLVLLDLGEVPENFAGKIIKLHPSRIIFIDAVDFGAPPGTIKMFTPGQIETGGVSTHTASLELFFSYLMEYLDAEISLMGIQPACTEYGTEMSLPVLRSIEKAVEFIKENAHRLSRADLPAIG